MKPFNQWLYEEVENTFGISSVLNHPTLTTWLTEATTDYTPTLREKQVIEWLQEDLFQNIHRWQEEELKFYFIGPLVKLVGFDAGNYNSFLDRKLSATINDMELSGKTDFMVAKGKQIPQQPYFFIHEYKKEKGSSNDPLGQLLVEMVVAQHLNKREHPIYGAYVLGRFWHFVILDGQQYSVSDAYMVTQKAIYEVLAILKQVKKYIEIFFK